MAAAWLGLYVQDPGGAGLGATDRGSGRPRRRSQPQGTHAEEKRKLAVGSWRGRKRAGARSGERESAGRDSRGPEVRRSAGASDSGAAHWASARRRRQRRRAGRREVGRVTCGTARARAHAGRAAWLNRGRLRSRLRFSRWSGRWVGVPVSGVRARLAAPASFWCLGRPEEPGQGRGGLTGPRAGTAGDAGGGALRRSPGCPGAGRRPRGPCPGVTSTSPPPNASSKVPSGLAFLGGGREPRRGSGRAAGAPRLSLSERRTWSGVWEREDGTRTGAARRGLAWFLWYLEA